MSRHPLHIQNRNDESSIALAKLLLAIDAIDTAIAWKSETDYVALPMDAWSRIVEERKAAERRTQEGDKETVRQLASEIDGVNLAKAYHAKFQHVRIPLQTWANILERRADANRPATTKAYATEYYILFGRFPK